MPAPELLAPAGNREKLDTALTYGARAVYLAGPGPNLRAPGAGFSADAFADAVAATHAAGARAYACLNALPRESSMHRVRAAVDHLGALPAAARPDALIVADPGVFALVRRELPHLPVHVSTQANTANAEAARFWAGLGAARVNIARELALPDIRALLRACPEVELEAFVHGAMCMAVSGRCAMSAHLNRRPANEGLCTHPCRFGYRATALRVEEKQRPGRDTWEVVEEDGFTSILAAEDLCLARYVPWFARAGVAALKIEGRMKSGGYLAHAVDAYATALADFADGRWRPDLYMDELRNTASRPLTTGFFLPGGRQAAWGVPHHRRPVLARVLRRLDEDAWEVAVRARWDAGAPFAVMRPGLRRPEVHPGEFALETADGQAVREGHSGITLVLRTDSPHLEEKLYLRGV